MDIGLSHLITVDGELVKAYWDTFDPNLSLGSAHEILVFSEDIPLTELFDRLPEAITKQRYNGTFEKASREDTIEGFTAKYNISFLTEHSGINVKQFIFTSNGIPWAMCSLETPVAIKKNIKTTFFFESTLTVNNKGGIATNLWNIDVGKFNINYAARIANIDKRDGDKFVIISDDPVLETKPTDEVIRKTIEEKGVFVDTPYVFEDGQIGIKLISKTGKDVVGVKAIFIRVIWNIGILIFIDTVRWGNTHLPNLTLVKGHQLKLTFVINFKEIKNDSTI